MGGGGGGGGGELLGTVFLTASALSQVGESFNKNFIEYIVILLMPCYNGYNDLLA